MDRTAWIVVALCVVGLVIWEIYLVKQTPPRPAPVTCCARTELPHDNSGNSRAFADSRRGSCTKPRQPTPSFAEKIETLRNSDVELRLTNRGGGIKEAVLLKQVAEKGQPVVLNSDKSAPIGAIIEQPSSPTLAEFTASPQSDSAVQFEQHDRPSKSLSGKNSSSKNLQRTRTTT